MPEIDENIGGAESGGAGSDASIVALDKFIRATRDSGYKGTSNALAELVDNAVQAGAANIHIGITEGTGPYPIEVRILDDGCGMSADVLRQALRFGGSTRFNDRSGLGRYGMGLPNASLSLARRLEVISWESRGSGARSYLDVDEISAGGVLEVPRPAPVREDKLPSQTESGTEIRWSNCDRLAYKRPSTIARKLHYSLGRLFRHVLWSGVTLWVNDEKVRAYDPLFLHPENDNDRASQYGETLEYEFAGEEGSVGVVKVRFTELPVAEWHDLPKREKSRRGITNGAGVSVVRAGREVDYGWILVGGKRKENYDDWWRCEIQFPPELDELFGISHTKQGVQPGQIVREALGDDLEAIARTLNSRARRAHQEAKDRALFSDSERLASCLDERLAPLPAAELQNPKVRELINADTSSSVASGARYTFVAADLADEHSFFTFDVEDGRIVVCVNRSHPFYRRMYRPLLDSADPEDQKLRTQLELLIFAAARSEALQPSQTQVLREQRLSWSRTLATYLNG